MIRLAVVLLCALAGTAAADRTGLERARAAAAELRFEEAALLLDRAWRAGTADPAAAGAIAALAGEIAATMGDRPVAARWFSLLVAIDPDARLPAGTSPKLIALVEEARRSLAGGRFAVRLRPDRPAGALRVGAVDPLGAVAALRIDGRAGPPARSIRWRRGAILIELLDRHGNVLHRTRRAIEALPAPAAAAAAAPSWYARWPVWAGLAGGLALGGGGLALHSAAQRRALEALHGESDMHQAAEALAIERRMKRSAIAAQVAGGAAALAAAAAVVLWRRERRAGLAPVPVGGDGLGAVLEVSF